MGYIYKITNKINGKAYVGQTSRTIEERWKEHVYNSKHDDFPLYRAMKKYGVENFDIQILEECTLDKLSEREIYWITQLDTFQCGYNATPGGAVPPLRGPMYDNPDQRHLPCYHCIHCADSEMRGYTAYRKCALTGKWSKMTRAYSCNRFEHCQSESSTETFWGYRARNRQIEDYRTEKQWQEAGYELKPDAVGTKMYSRRPLSEHSHLYMYYLPHEVQRRPPLPPSEPKPSSWEIAVARWKASQEVTNHST